MKTTNKTLFSSIVGLITILLIPVLSYGGETKEEIILRCCTDITCPTRYVSEGIPGVTQTVTFKKQIVPMGDEEMVIPTSRDPEYEDWLKFIRKNYDKSTAINLYRSSRVSIIAKCASEKRAHSISHDELNFLTCPEGDSILLFDDLKCSDPEHGPYSIVEITKTSRDENDNQRDPSEQEKIAEANRLLEGFKIRQRERERINEQRKVLQNRFDKLNRKVLNSGFLETLSFSSSLKFD